MTTAIAPDARRTVGLFSTGLNIAGHKPKISFGKGTKTDKLVLQVKDMPVFRSGTFRDSMGYQHTWENIHIDQMVLHYAHLRDAGIFADVPVRKGHGSFFGDPMDSLVGWHTDLRAETMTSTHDGKDYHYLLASYEIFDEDAAKHVEDGDWRNRSSEVGFYLTNAEAEYWPVYQGFAYVDIPAVEGLNGFSKAVKSRSNFSMMMEEEVADMGDKDQNQPPAETPPAETPLADTPPAETPPAEAPPAETPPVQEAAATPVTQPAAPAEGTHSAPSQTHNFKVNGQPVADFAAVQAHIDTLEAANVEREKTVRGDFVKALASAGKIPATQIEALTNHASELTPTQYASWSASYESVPASPLFGQYGASEAGEGSTPVVGAGGNVTDRDTEIKRLEGVVALHSRTMTKEQVEKTESYTKLQQLLSATS